LRSLRLSKLARVIESFLSPGAEDRHIGGGQFPGNAAPQRLSKRFHNWVRRSPMVIVPPSAVETTGLGRMLLKPE
jgi:hypothetical protein